MMLTPKLFSMRLGDSNCFGHSNMDRFTYGGIGMHCTVMMSILFHLD